MVDDVVADSGDGLGETFKTDDDGGRQVPVCKIELGADSSFDGYLSETNPMPVMGKAAENAAASGNPVLSGGRYDASPRTLGDGDVGAVALDVKGAILLGANSGIDIGDVDITSQVPGTGATNLGKAIDSVVGATDTGVALLAKHKEDQAHLTTADGDYDILTMDSLGSLHVNAEAHHIFDELDATAGWTVLGNDTANLATTTKHVMGTLALTFDKVNGAANTVFAGIQKTLSSTDLGNVSPHDILQGAFYVSDTADISYLFLRLGTDSSNYNEWRIDGGAITAGVFEVGALSIGDADYDGITGNGLDASAITYIAVGSAFNAETDTLAGIIFDQISYHTNQHTSSSITSEVTSSVSSANVNISKIGNKVVNTEAGNASTGTQRVIIATDDVNLSAIKTATEIIDNSVYVDDADWTALTSSHQLIGGVYQSTPGTVTDGDTGPLRCDVNGHLITSEHGESLALADDVSNTVNLKVDESGSFMGQATFGYVFDGTAWDRMRGNSADGVTVNLGANNDVTVSSLPASTNTIEVVGDVAHDAAAAGNPVLVGARATADVEALTEVAEADATYVATDLQGVSITRPFIAAQEQVQYHNANTAGTELAVTGLDAGGAGIHNYVTSVIVHNSHASTNGFIQLLDGSGGTVLATFPAPATGGAVINLTIPIKQTTANTALYWDASAAITTLYVTIVGYQGQG